MNKFYTSQAFHCEASVRMKYESSMNGIFCGGIEYVLGVGRWSGLGVGDFPSKNINIDEEKGLLDVTNIQKLGLVRFPNR